METYFFIGLGLIVLNIIGIFLTCRLKREDFYFDNKIEQQEFPYGFKFLCIILSIIIFAFCFLNEYLSSHSLPFIFIPVIIGYPIYYYFCFICKYTHLINLHKKEFFTTILALCSAFYLLFIPLAENVELSYELSLLINSKLPMIELIMIVYVHLFCYVPLLNLVVYFDLYNYVIRKTKISAQQFHKQHSSLSIMAFIISGYVSSIILNSQFLTFPQSFNFEKFQNIILIYQIFLSATTIILTLLKANSKSHKNNK